MTHKIQIEMVLEGIEGEDVTIATLQPVIEVTAQDDEETLMDKVYTHINEWWSKTSNIGCTPRYNLDELIAIVETM